MGTLDRVAQTGFLWVLLTTVALGQAPTYSIEAVAVNDIATPGGPTGTVSISHGDVVTAKVFIRNWSPGGEKLRAYQIKINDASYASGEQGVVQPVDFQMNTDKDPNAFIDEADPQWVHYGHPTIPLTDSASPGYRWLSVLLDPFGGPVSAQDGKKFSCGTVKLTPSPNAKGSFTIALVEDPYTTGLITTESEQIFPIEYERLTIVVEPTARWLKVLSSDPSDGAVDARTTSKSSGTGGSWTTVRLSFNADSASVTANDLIVQDGSRTPPRIQKVSSDGIALTVQLDRPIQPGAWTTITHRSSSTSIRLGRFPGDVDGDGKADTRDVLTLLNAVNGGQKLADYRSDLDGNGTLGPGDVLRLLDVITDGGARTGSSGAADGNSELRRPKAP